VFSRLRGPARLINNRIVSNHPSGTTSDFNRRQFLHRLGLVGAGAASTGPLLATLVHYADDVKAAAPANAAAATGTSQHQWVMVMDLRNCDGCGRCTLSCQAAHSLAPDQTWIKVYQMTSATGEKYFMPRACMQCEDAPCMRVCPVGATFRAKDGVVLIDQNRCIGCRMCMAACPYEARYFNWSEPRTPIKRMPIPTSPEFPVPQQKGTVGKCTLCSDRLPHGQLPHCVEDCPMGALYIGDLVTDVAMNGLGKAVKLSQFLADNDAVRFKDDLNTHPRVYYIVGHGQNLLEPQT
jgi:molybdopterin-containing oxidoreductase family iron-sulfur binding subunit